MACIARVSSGSSKADPITLTGAVQGRFPFTLSGGRADDAFMRIGVRDLQASRTIWLPDQDGTLVLAKGSECYTVAHTTHGPVQQPNGLGLED